MRHRYPLPLVGNHAERDAEKRTTLAERQEPGSDQVLVRGSDDIHRVKKITTPIRWALYLILLLPKMAISMTLLTIRTVWLAATDSFADLILNAIALEFVSAIDELLFEAMLPASSRAILRRRNSGVNRSRSPLRRTRRRSLGATSDPACTSLAP